MSRLKALKPDEMSKDQEALRSAYLDVWKRAEGGPFDLWYHSPELGRLSHELGAYCRFRSKLEWDVLETAILVVASHWAQDYEWNTHAPNALKAGLTQPMIDAIAAKKPPMFATVEQSLAHDVAREILETRKVAPETYARASTVFGEAQMVELAAVVGWYTSLAIQMNVFDVGA